MKGKNKKNDEDKEEVVDADEIEDYDAVPEERNRQKGKSGYTPYKVGGGRRTQKR